MGNKINSTSGNPLKVFLYFSVPSVVGLLAVSSAQTIDAIFLGNYAGSSALASVNIIMPFFFLVFGFAVMLVTGSSVMCGKYLGEKNTSAASAVFSKSMVLLFVFTSFIMAASLLYSESIVKILGANEELTTGSALYLRYISLFYLPFLGSFALSVFVRIDGRPVLASAGLILGAVINLVLDWLLVAHLDMGLKGAAIATGSSQVASFVLLSLHFFSSDCHISFFWRVKGWKELLRACYNGLSEFTNEISVGVLVLLFNWVMVNRMGVAGVAAFSVINYTLSFGIMLSYGISDALLPLVSTNFGARQSGRINSFVLIASGGVLGIEILLFALLALFPVQMVDVFLEPGEIETTQIAVEFVAIAKWAFLFSGINMIVSAYHTAMHKPVESAVIAILRSLIFPVTGLFLLPVYLGNQGIYWTIPVAESITFLVAFFLFVKNRPGVLIS